MITPEGMLFRDRAVYLESSDTLVLADLHLGRARTSNVHAPLTAADGMPERMRVLLECFSPELVVIAGDIFDAFDGVPPGVSEHLDAITKAIERGGAELVFLRGNHDTMLGEVYDGNIRDRILLEDTCISHGHQLPDQGADRYVIGHEHPAIRIEGRKRPSYLFCPDGWETASVLVLPAFTRLVRGTVMNRRRTADCHSPIIRAGGIDRYRPIVRDEQGDDTLAFPRLSSLRAFL